MISSHDRSSYIGASDTKYVIGNWKTKTFDKWWLKKIGINTDNFSNKYTMAGNNFEHKIIEALDIPNIEYDKQIIKGRLRINLDANTEEEIHEIKTYVYDNGFNIEKHKDYINQVVVQMYGSEIYQAKIHAYGLKEEDYNNYFNKIDKNRLSEYVIEYDKKWIKNIYEPRLKYLEKCLIEGKWPDIEDFKKEFGGLNDNLQESIKKIQK